MADPPVPDAKGMKAFELSHGIGLRIWARWAGLAITLARFAV